MEYYVIKKKNKNQKLGKFHYEEGYVFKPNIKKKDLIEISSLSILNPEITNAILKKKCDKTFRKLATMILSLLKEEDATTGEAMIALNELEKEKYVIQRKYKEYIKKEEKEKYLKRIKVLETELKEKMILLNLQEQRSLEEEKGHSR